MAINKPVAKGTKQRLSQADNLIVGVGDYGNKKTFNLTKKQLGASGMKAASRKVAISRTEYKNGKVYGPAGKLLTGRVDMGGGNIAVYRKGVRVKASAAKPSSPDKPKPPPRPPAGDRGTNRGPLMQSDRNPRGGPTAGQTAKARAAAAARGKASAASDYVWDEKNSRWIPKKRGSK